MKRHPTIYLLAVMLATLAVSACAPIRESKSPLVSYSHLYVGWVSDSQPAVIVKDIEKIGEPDTRYIPSLPATQLWLRPGTYEATVECFRPQTDPFNIPILKEAALLDPDGKIRFTIEYHGVVLSRLAEQYNSYQMDCATSPDGKPEFVVTSQVGAYNDD